MTLEQLKSYKSDKAEIQEITQKLNAPFGQDEFIASSVVMDYRKGYPIPRTLVGYDLTAEKISRGRWERRRSRLIARTHEVEEYIEGIKDGRTRRCFSMYFEDGWSERKIARVLHIDRSLVSKIIRSHLKITDAL